MIRNAATHADPSTIAADRELIRRLRRVRLGKRRLGRLITALADPDLSSAAGRPILTRIARRLETQPAHVGQMIRRARRFVLEQTDTGEQAA